MIKTLDLRGVVAIAAAPDAISSVSGLRLTIPKGRVAVLKSEPASWRNQPGPNQICRLLVPGTGKSTAQCERLQTEQNGSTGLHPGARPGTLVSINVVYILNHDATCIISPYELRACVLKSCLSGVFDILVIFNELVPIHKRAFISFRCFAN